jgi:hypothetical protein
MEDLVFRAACHPEATGNIPEEGEQEWRLSFPLDDGRTLVVLMGRPGRDNMAAMLMEERLDDLIEEH